MKWIRNIFAASAVAIAAVACTIESEDTFSTSPVAPVMDAHSDILITNGTKAESVTLAPAARASCSGIRDFYLDSCALYRC